MINNRVPKRLTKSMRGKLGIVIFFILASFLVLAVRLCMLTFQNGNKYETIVLGQQEHSSQKLAFERGNILDRNGNILATNEKLYTVILEPKNILASSGLFEEESIDALVTYFGFDKDEITKIVYDNKEKYYLPLDRLKNLTYAQVKDYKDFISYASKSKDGLSKEELEIRSKAKLVRGIIFEEKYKRIYPYDDLACRVLGFSSMNNEGSWGIEEQYNKILNGIDGRAYYNFDEELVQQETVVEPENGKTVVSTIDMQIQSIIEKNLATFDHGIGSKSTSILVMNPQNGEILGMASSNPFDLNNPMDEECLKKDYSDAEIKKLKANAEKLAAEEKKLQEEATTEQVPVEDAESDADTSEKKSTEATTEEKKTEEKPKTIYDAYYELWRNPIISDTFEPGSTYKPFTVATGFECGMLTGNEHYECSGSYGVRNRSVGCSHVHGTINLKNAIAQSCNVAMMNIAFKEKTDIFYEYQAMFGFGKKTGIDLPGEASAAGLIYDAEMAKDSYITLATNSFGQGFNCTMIQMATAFSSLINGGYYYEPHIVKEIQNDNGDVIEDVQKELLRYTVSESTCKKLRSYLKETVISGTGVRAQISGYSIGGKTGTAEKIPRNKEDYVISFIGYTSTDNPELLIYVVIDEPHVKDQANAALAVMLERECMEQIVDYMGIEATGKKKEATWDDYVDEYESVFNVAFYGDKKGKKR